VIAVGLSWSGGGFDVSGLDVPLAGLFTNNVSNGFPIGVLFLLAAAAGLGVALFRPETRIMSTTFLVTGGASLFFLLWLMIRIMSQLQGASLFDVLSIGFWLAFLASIGVLVGGIMLRVTGRTAAA
jgi:hypothetical protein